MAVGALALVLAPSAASASTSTGSLSVTATVLSSATVTTLPVAFGNYDPTSASATNGTGTVTVIATSGTPYTIGLDNGANASGTQRRLSDGGGHFVNYDLYSDSGRTTAWNNTATVSGTGTLLAQPYTVYGTIPAGQSSPSGLYTDTVTVTATF